MSTQIYAHGENICGTSNDANGILYTKSDGTKDNVQTGLNELTSEINTLNNNLMEDYIPIPNYTSAASVAISTDWGLTDISYTATENCMLYVTLGVKGYSAITAKIDDVPVLTNNNLNDKSVNEGFWNGGLVPIKKGQTIKCVAVRGSSYANIFKIS